MSYCRWSGEANASDVYAYQAADAFVVHVANSRLDTRGTRDGVLPRAVPIGLPHDGETFKDPSLETFRERLVQLRGEGYRVPDYVLTRIDQEIAEREAAIVHALR